MRMWTVVFRTVTIFFTLLALMRLLFGRGGEELELLCENGVPFEIVPGITSAIAVPAYNGIPVTHRDFCSSVHIITGHRRAEQGYDIDFEALVRTKGTLVFLMGIAAVIAIPLAVWLAGKLLEQYSYRVSGYGWVFAAAVVIALVIAFASVFWQTLKAARTNPAEELKKE